MQTANRILRVVLSLTTVLTLIVTLLYLLPGLTEVTQNFSLTPYLIILTVLYWCTYIVYWGLKAS